MKTIDRVQKQRGDDGMQDKDGDIVKLLQLRDERGIEVLRLRHGRLAMKIAYNILGCDADAEECVSDAYRAMWEQIPPLTPNPFLPYFLRTVRNAALKQRRSMQTQKRWGGELLSQEAWDTLAELELFSDREEDCEHIREALNGFLGTLRREDRILFVRRYWFEDPVGDIAAFLGLSENHVRVRLTRCKKKLKNYLESEGITV